MTLRRNLALTAIAGQIVFVIGWIVGGAIEGHGYSVGRHDISDLGALTAHHAPLYFAVCAIGGFAAILFALGALVPALAVPGRGPALGAVLVALSLPAFDTASDTFFRLDCRAADHGCSLSQATTSWHGKAHIAAFAFAALASLLAPFLLAPRMQLLDAWRDLATPTRRFGIGLIVALVVTSGTTDTAVGGWAQRAVILYVVAGFCLLARRVLEVAGSGVEVRGHRVDGGVVAS